MRRARPATRRQVLAGASAAVAAAPVLASAKGVPSARGASAAASKLAAELFAGGPAPALSLAVASGDAILWAEALGQANMELETEATPEHTFRLGSVSKVLTTTAAARLVSRGVLDLDAPIAHYLPGLPQPHRTTTLLQLLTHRGGVRHYLPKDFDLSAPGGAIYARLYPSSDDALALFIDDPLVAPAGTKVSYSSYGYTLASRAIEAAAGTEFLQLIEAEVGTRFGLPSLAADDPWTVLPNRTAGYMNARDITLLYGGAAEAARPQPASGWANIPFVNPAYSWAGAGFLMTPADAARFGAGLLDGPDARISVAERKLLFTPLTEAAPGSPPLGLGWRVDADARARPRWRHEGATPGCRFALTVYPEQGLSIAMAGNVMSMPLDVLRAASDLADMFG